MRRKIPLRNADFEHVWYGCDSSPICHGVLVNAVKGTIKAWRQTVHDGVPEVRVKLGGITTQIVSLSHVFVNKYKEYLFQTLQHRTDERRCSLTVTCY